MVRSWCWASCCSTRASSCWPGKCGQGVGELKLTGQVWAGRGAVLSELLQHTGESLLARQVWAVCGVVPTDGAGVGTVWGRKPDREFHRTSSVHVATY